MKLSFAFVVVFTAFSYPAFADLPGNFSPVTDVIYRSAQPTPENMQDLKALGIKTILDVNNDGELLAVETAAAAEFGIKVISHPMSGFWYPKDSVVNAALADLENPANYPILVHCEHGQDRTGLIIGLYRIEAEGVKPAVAYQEMLAHGFHKILVFLNHYFEERTGYED